MLLAGDIGGTKTVLALFTAESGVARPVYEERYPSDKFDSLEEIIEKFFDDINLKDRALIESASFGVAGPVVNGRSQVTNLTWVIDASVISQAYSIPVTLLNDLESIANAVPHLLPEDVYTINPGQPIKNGALAVVAPGTGLGEAFLTHNGGQYESYPSEGGHASFAPTTTEQLDLLNYLRPRLGHISYERVCSGKGIPNIYNFWRDATDIEEPQWLHEQLAEVEDKTPTIVQTAVSNKAAICTATLNMFFEILGDEAGNMALKVLATGGVYLGGGILPRILPQLVSSRFLAKFCDKGRFSSLLSQIPIHVIRNPKVALYGAAYEALRLLPEDI